MRLRQQESAIIVSTVHSMDADAEIYLFGSRARDDLKGGDIDLLLISDQITFTKKIDLLAKLKALLGDQKIDIKVLMRKDLEQDEFFRLIRTTAIRLN